MTSETATDVIRRYNADGVHFLAFAKHLEVYAEFATIQDSPNGCQVVAGFIDHQAADECERMMAKHWMLCIRRMTEGKVAQ